MSVLDQAPTTLRLAPATQTTSGIIPPYPRQTSTNLEPTKESGLQRSSVFSIPPLLEKEQFKASLIAKKIDSKVRLETWWHSSIEFAEILAQTDVDTVSFLCSHHKSRRVDSPTYLSCNQTGITSYKGEVVVAVAYGLQQSIGTGGRLDPKVVKFRSTTGGSLHISFDRSEGRVKTPTVPILTPNEMVALVRASFSLNIKELAKVLQVGRPTIYAWISGEAEPQQENLRRLNKLVSYAQNWARLTSQPLGENVRRPHFNGKSLVELFMEGLTKGESLTVELQSLATKVEQESKTRENASIRKSLAIRGIEHHEDSQALDLLTGKRIGEE